MHNIFNFIISVLTTYSFIFIFRKLINSKKTNVLLELKYTIVISIIYSILYELTIKPFKLWVYYTLLQIAIYTLYKEIYKEKKFEIFIYYIITFVVFQMSDILTGIIIDRFSILMNMLNENIFYSIAIPQLMLILIAILLTTIVSHTKINNINFYMQENKILWIYTNIIMSMYMILIYYYSKTTYTQNIIISSIFVLCFFLFISYFMFIILNRLYIEKNTRVYIEMYNNVIEESLENMNLYKHDQRNILLSIGGFLENNDIPGLKEYFYEDIAKNQYDDNKILLGLVNIENSPVKGLLYAKIIKANSKQLKLHINIKDIIEDFFIKDIDMCKILGILIDNAIESSVESKERLISIGIWNDEDEIYIIVSNSFKEEPIINKIFEKGYSTKGADRGLGLYTLKELNENTYHNIDINKRIEDCLFIIEVIINKQY